MLLGWSADILAQISKSPDTFNTYIRDVLAAQVALLDICMGSVTAKSSLKRSALTVTRRGLRAAFSLKNDYQLIIKTIIDKLTAKAPNPAPRSAILLGVVCGVCARAEQLKEVLEGLKKDIYAFFLREIIGSRTPVSKHISGALHDFFTTFTTAEDFDKELVPALERALLRAPEVVLNDVVTSLFTSVPDSIDLSKPILDKLLKQFLSCVKSSNANIRNGAVTAFKIGITRSKKPDETAIQKIADELVNPLKTGKVTAADQRVLYAMMIESLPWSEKLAKKVSSGLAETVSKEPNETAVTTLSSAIFQHLPHELELSIEPDKAVVDAISKGLVDKRPSFRRIWVARLGDLVWGLGDKPSSVTQAFVGGVLQKLLDTWLEVCANPLPAAQSGLVTAGYVFTAISLEKLSKWDDPKVQALLKQKEIIAQSLATIPKISFMLSYKVYSKLTLDEDHKWTVRALAATADHVVYEESHAELWALAFLYMLCAQGIRMETKKEALAALSAAYLRKPENIGRCILNGVWRWLRRLEEGEKDCAPTAAKTAGTYLNTAIHAICLPPTTAGGLKTGSVIEVEVVKDQLVNLAVVAHHQLMPDVDWIRLCQRVGIDPGELAKEKAGRLVGEIRMYTGLSGRSSYIRDAALRASATLAFVAPETITPLIVKLITDDLNPGLLRGIGPQEAAIWKTPEGVTYVDVLSKSNSSAVTKGKDTDTLKWEAELRAQLAQKKGAERKLTADEKARVEDQLAKEVVIRRRVEEVNLKLTRGIGVIQSLAQGPPTVVEMWMGQAVRALLKAMEAGAGLIVGDMGVKAFLVSPSVPHSRVVVRLTGVQACSEHVSPRLGVLRSFIGIDTLRALGIKELAPELQEEPLGGKFA